ncbi:MAG TPA: hypothetical protein PKC18_20745, partial [Lacipirellulaceae bacterium]|nr:hypothetical protein [Lacipirellulaceae bacterium]
MHRLTARLIALLALALPLLASASPAHATLVIGTAGVPVTQNFDALGTSLNLASLNGGAWRISEAINAADFSTADTVLTQVQTGTLTISSLRGSYNFRDGANTLDRAVGMHVGGGFTHNRSIMLQILNDTGQPLEELTVSWDFEKYRNGSKTLQITSFHGDTGNTWL